MTVNKLLTEYQAVGGQWVRRGGVGTPGPPPPPATAPRFPGDPRADVNARMYVGIDELDLNPQSISTTNGEVAAPETLAGKPCGMQRLYYTSWSAITPGTGQAFTQGDAQLAKGRIPWISIFVAPGNSTGQTWAQAADGRNHTIWYNFIAAVEESTTPGPRYFTMCHEPEDNISGSGGMTTGNFADMQVAFRSVMDDYADAKGTGATRADRIANYQWKNLAFAPVFTDWCFKRTDAAKIANFMTQSNGTAVPTRTFDFMGVDTYIGLNVSTEPTTAWIANWQAAVAYCENAAHKYPIMVSEFGIRRSYPDAGTKLKAWFDQALDGTHDIGAMCYYNTSLASPPSSGLWLLDDSGNDGLLTKYVNLLKDSRTIRFYDVGPYSKPAGVIG